MTPIEIVKLILSDNHELEKSTRYYNLTLEKKADVIISQRPELKNCFIAGVVKRYLAIGTLGSGKSFRYVDTADTMKCFVEYVNEIYPDFDIDAVIEV